ncbi:MAG TPA: Rieske 2Fe-2S domain-containing protein [Chloroflexota bacterium]|nr:Rieske 2Fe-2S domain-containing protein [Chloroflexota bacterium]
MLSTEDNKLVAQIGPGTMMGDVFRRYWLPLLLSSELPGPDSDPVRIRHLGEDLIAFRTTDGQVGLIQNNCPHRGASLFFGRNEENGLRCVYHGWKFDVSGQCVDMPNEPAESNFKNKVQARAYPCRERNGVIWTYLGPKHLMPEDLPAFEWNLLPQSRVYISKRYQECNWAQALEGGIDSTHSAFLHSRPSGNNVLDTESRSTRGMEIRMKHKHAHFECLETDYGLWVAARRDAGEEEYYWRITQFLMPSYSMIPPYGLGSIGGHAWVPMDDHTTMSWSVTWNPLRDLSEKEMAGLRSGGGIHLNLDNRLPLTTQPGGTWRSAANASNDYQRDREAMKTSTYSGIFGIAMQDQAMQESMGPIYDRTQEHLGTSDVGIIEARRMWLKAARGLRDQGVAPVGSENPQAYNVRSTAVIYPKDADWVKLAAERMEARDGVLAESA